MDAITSIFSGGDAGSRGGAVAEDFNRMAIDELKRQFNETQANISPFMQVGRDAIPRAEEGATVEGLDAIVGRLMNTNTFGSLVDERTRSVQGQLAAGGLTRSGTALTEAAKIPTDLALAIEQLIFGRNANFVGSGQNAALGLGSLGGDNASNIASLFNNTGQTINRGIISDQQASAQAGANLLSAGTALGVAGMKYSDPRLKKNVVQIGAIKNLKLFQWDWIDEAKDTIISSFPKIGFMADEVEEKYPHHVGEFAGFKVIGYSGLLEELEAA